MCVWGSVLRENAPFLSIEITKERPPRCPGCYAYSPEHLGPGATLRQLSDYHGNDPVEAVLELVRRMRPVHVSIVRGEPRVRYRELSKLPLVSTAWESRCNWLRARCAQIPK